MLKVVGGCQVSGGGGGRCKGEGGCTSLYYIMESYIDMVNVIVLCCAGKIIIIISSILIRVSFF